MDPVIIRHRSPQKYLPVSVKSDFTVGSSQTDYEGKKITCNTKGKDILGKYNLRIVTAGK